jgi:hypothetical protein
MFCYNNFGKITKEEIYEELFALKKSAKNTIKDVILN